MKWEAKYAFYRKLLVFLKHGTDWTIIGTLILSYFTSKMQVHVLTSGFFLLKPLTLYIFCREIRKLYTCILVILRHTVVNFQSKAYLSKRSIKKPDKKEIEKTTLKL